MSIVSLLGVEVKNNPTTFDAPYEFLITFECHEQLQKGELTRPVPLPHALTDWLQILSGSSPTSAPQPRTSPP